MGNDQEYLYGDYAMLKLIRDPDTVRLKLCPAVLEEGDGDARFNELEGSVSIDLDREGCNMLIRQVRKMRDRTFGKDE